MFDRDVLQLDRKRAAHEAVEAFLSPTDTGYSSFEHAAMRQLEEKGSRDIQLLEVRVYMGTSGSVSFNPTKGHATSHLSVRFERNGGTASLPMGRLTVKNVTPRPESDSPLAAAVTEYHKHSVPIAYNADQTR